MRPYAIFSPSRWSRPLILMLVLLFSEARLVALAGDTAPVPAGARVDTSFQCHAETSGTRAFPAPGDATATRLATPCFYRLYATECDAPSTSGDVTRQQCRIASLMEFALHPGETRTVTKLPAGYRYCVSLEAPPTLEACSRNPAVQ